MRLASHRALIILLYLFCSLSIAAPSDSQLTEQETLQNRIISVATSIHIVEIDLSLWRRESTEAGNPDWQPEIDSKIMHLSSELNDLRQTQIALMRANEELSRDLNFKYETEEQRRANLGYRQPRPPKASKVGDKRIYPEALREKISPYIKLGASEMEVMAAMLANAVLGDSPFARFHAIMQFSPALFKAADADRDFIDGLYILVMDMARDPALRSRHDPRPLEKGNWTVKMTLAALAGAYHNPHVSSEDWMRQGPNLFQDFRRIFLLHLPEQSYLVNKQMIDPIIKKFSEESPKDSGNKSVFLQPDWQTREHLLSILPPDSELYSLVNAGLKKTCQSVLKIKE